MDSTISVSKPWRDPTCSGLKVSSSSVHRSLRRIYSMKLFIQHSWLLTLPQHLLMRVAVGIHKVTRVSCLHPNRVPTRLQGNMERVIESYDLMSEKFFTHASPTMFNAGKLPIAALTSATTTTTNTYKSTATTTSSSSSPLLLRHHHISIQGTPRPQLSSCFLVAMEGDSIEGTRSYFQPFFF
jgi:ribonucleotide reductase alpha subunit